MTAVPKKKYTLEEYLELDRNSEERYEYFDGEVFAMAGGSPSHARISLNVSTSLQEYLLISQDRPHVIQHVKQSKRRWLRIGIEGMDSEVKLESINLTLTLNDLYERVDFKSSKTDQ